MRAELAETVDHAMRAAGYAAGGIRETMGPRLAPAATRMRGMAMERFGSMAAFGPPAEATRDGRRRERRQSRRQARHDRRMEKRGDRRWARMLGLMAGGIALGAVAAYLMRQRRQREWEEYDPTEAMETTPDSGFGASEETVGARDSVTRSDGRGF